MLTLFFLYTAEICTRWQSIILAVFGFVQTLQVFNALVMSHVGTESNWDPLFINWNLV
jgi:hypothetical protein